MAGSKHSILYNQVVQITRVYLGPAADRFIARQVQNHLNKPPDDLSKADLLKLIDWIRASISLITDDTELVEEYTSQLHKLAQAPPVRKTSRAS